MNRTRLPAVRRSFLVELFWRFHRAVYRASGGRVGGRLGRLPVLLLTTRGRRSGVRRTVALTYLRMGAAYIVVASNAGDPSHPAWWLNLMARPEATVQVGPDEIAVAAREATGEEREGLWERIVGAEPSYQRYQERTSRRIPVVILEPRARS
jgi:deazaflavin-dependent oxidoreductase (nitroreductase family)